MELTSPTEIKGLLAKHGGQAFKGLGQNFLIDKNALQKIVATAELKPDDVVSEVGPGIGVLTEQLAQRAGRVIAVEKDRLMVKILSETLANYKNVEIIHGDALKIEIPDLFKNSKIKNYKIVANIPYYITSPLIRAFLETKNPPKEIVLLVQKEVAQRICSKPPQMSLLAVSVQFYAQVKIISYVSKNCFWPSPKVDSAIIKITPSARPAGDSKAFFRVVKAGFLQPRKQLANNLSKGLKISKEKTEKCLLQNNIKPSQRAETLSVSDWQNLAKSCE